MYGSNNFEESDFCIHKPQTKFIVDMKHTDFIRVPYIVLVKYEGEKELKISDDFFGFPRKKSLPRKTRPTHNIIMSCKNVTKHQRIRKMEEKKMCLWNYIMYIHVFIDLNLNEENFLSNFSKRLSKLDDDVMRFHPNNIENGIFCLLTFGKLSKFFSYKKKVLLSRQKSKGRKICNPVQFGCIQCNTPCVCDGQEKKTS